MAVASKGPTGRCALPEAAGRAGGGAAQGVSEGQDKAWPRGMLGRVEASIGRTPGPGKKRHMEGPVELMPSTRRDLVQPRESVLTRRRVHVLGWLIQFVLLHLSRQQRHVAVSKQARLRLLMGQLSGIEQSEGWYRACSRAAHEACIDRARRLRTAAQLYWGKGGRTRGVKALGCALGRREDHPTSVLALIGCWPCRLPCSVARRAHAPPSEQRRCWWQTGKCVEGVCVCV